MNKRIYRKIIHEFEEGLSDFIRMYLDRPEGDDFEDISIEFIQLGLSMLLTFQADKGIIRIGNENWIEEISLKETHHELKKAIEFEGNIKWIYKKKNVPTEFNQGISIKFDLTDHNKKRLPFRIEYPN